MHTFIDVDQWSLFFSKASISFTLRCFTLFNRVIECEPINI